MLYEVITAGEVVEARTQEIGFRKVEFSQKNELLINGEVVKIIVITSYSIHYTKLYETNLSKCDRIAVSSSGDNTVEIDYADPVYGNGDVAIGVEIKCDRITSYNVCYTKLLRIAHIFARTCGLQRPASGTPL